MARGLPPLNALRAFEASARLGSFVAAAAELHVSAAAVSQQVRRLERYLDHVVQISAALCCGEAADSFPAVGRVRLLCESTARLRTRRRCVLTLTTLAAFANGWLLPRLPASLAAHGSTSSSHELTSRISSRGHRARDPFRPARAASCLRALCGEDCSHRGRAVRGGARPRRLPRSRVPCCRHHSHPSNRDEWRACRGRDSIPRRPAGTHSGHRSC